MDEHLKTGALGEELACRYLEAKGYSILERNWRSGHRELDLIAQRGPTLAIVEVKTRSAGSLLRARDSVTQRKQSLLIQAADHYVRTRGLERPELHARAHRGCLLPASRQSPPLAPLCD